MSSEFSFSRLLVVITLGLAISACDPSPVSPLPGTSIKPGRLAAAQELLDGGFENGLASWHACSNDMPVASSDSANGLGAMSLPTQGCIYQTVEAADEKTYQLSCQTKRSGDGWAGLTLAYLDENYLTLQQQEVEISSEDYRTTSVTLNPRNGATYVEVLAYTNGAVLVFDECSLESTAEHPGVISNPLPANTFPDHADMQAQQSFSRDAEDVAGNDIDWQEAWMAHSSLGIYLAWSTYTELPSDTWGLGVYLDTDQNRDTGFTGFYDEFPIGVDYLVEGVEQFRYTGDGTNWVWELIQTGGSDVQYIAANSTGNLEQIDLFFLADSASIGGNSVDYYPDSVIDQSAENATRFFTYDATYDASTDTDNPPVTVVPPVNPEPPTVDTPMATLDIRVNLEGHEAWSVTNASNFPNQIHTKNTGNLLLTDVKVTSTLGVDCDYTYARLEPGESKQEICRTPAGNSHYQHATATATAADGQEVRDTDSSVVETVAQFSRNLMSVTVDKPISNIGDTVTIDVQVASSGNHPDNRISRIESSVDQCSRSFDPPVALDSIETYQCSIAIDQLPLKVEFEAVSANSTIVKSANVVEAGVVTFTAQINPSSIKVDLFRVNVTVENIGALDVSDLDIRGRNMDCKLSPIFSPPSIVANGERSGLYYCTGMISERGGFADSTLIVTGTTPDGQTFETVLESSLANSRDASGLSISLANSNSNIIQGIAGETVTVRFALENRGYFDVRNINLNEFISLANHPEYPRISRFNPDAVDPPRVSVENCASVANSITSQPNFVMEPGDAIEFECPLTLPPSNIYMQAAADYDTVNPQFDDATSGSTSLGYFKLVVDQPSAADLDVLERYIPVADAAMLNPVVSADRVTQVLANRDFENVAENNMPARWIAGCEDGAINTSGYYGNAVGLRSGSCATYVLDSNEMAQLSGYSFNLGCEITQQARTRKSSQQYASVAISLNGVETTAESEFAQGYLSISADAPATVTEGYISLYTNASIEIDNCQLILTGSVENGASIKISNHFDGSDVYRRSTAMDFLVRVTNDGNTDLQNIEVSSSRLQCSRNYASLRVAETKEFICAGNGETLKHWDDRVSHLMTASADSALGIVADSDFSGYGNPYTMDNNAISVLVNSQPQDAISPVAIGSDVEIQISLVQRANEKIVQVISSIPACARRIDSSIEQGDYIAYTCTIENIAETTAVQIAPLGAGEFPSEVGFGVLTSGPGIFTIEVSP